MFAYAKETLKSALISVERQVTKEVGGWEKQTFRRNIHKRLVYVERMKSSVYILSYLRVRRL